MQLIAKAGLDAVTVRDVAEAAGCSTAIVSHYFHNKKELLHVTYTAAIERATGRAEAALAATGDLKAFLAEIMPLDEDRLTEWSIWLAFWAKAVSDPDIAAAQRNCVLRTRGNILRILDDLNARGELVAGVDRAHAARRVLATITGMAVQVMFDREDWPTDRQHGLIDPELRALYIPSRIPASIAEPAAPTHRENVVAMAGER
ncbi:MAG: TetR/AcrR family transcriptional regulator [Phenylobacterium sp.]|uniref:TetR/AcrR family transcriptional regulator n=1 Tax=Phenylobacterium sp. TaxID=1871053 RepID=UPI002733C3DE|nr:TetR/AcrR family transcriptional regulator [Phenylobacterium sp.]MDP3745811.1 TetR/AcrR family transcriptional regulator [Phenylobacterium sp.]